MDKENIARAVSWIKSKRNIRLDHLNQLGVRIKELEDALQTEGLTVSIKCYGGPGGFFDSDDDEDDPSRTWLDLN